jgi:hypothetical protein
MARTARNQKTAELEQPLSGSGAAAARKKGSQCNERVPEWQSQEVEGELEAENASRRTHLSSAHGQFSVHLDTGVENRRTVSEMGNPTQTM